TSSIWRPPRPLWAPCASIAKTWTASAPTLTGSWRRDMPTHAPPSAIRHAPETILAAFGHALRTAGLPVTTEATRTFIDAVAHLDLTSRSHVYWAGRATYCSSAGDLVTYDRVFTAWFERDLPPTAQARPDQVAHQAALPSGEEEDDGAAAVV